MSGHDILRDTMPTYREHTLAEVLRPALPGADHRRRSALVTEADAAALQIVGRHLDDNVVTHAGADMEFAHLARRVGEDFVLVVELHTEVAVGQHFRDRSVELEQLFFR